MDWLIAILIVTLAADALVRLVVRVRHAYGRARQAIDTEHIAAAVRAACYSEGLPTEASVSTADLVGTGKLYAVLHHAADRLGKDHELRTVQDVIDWLAVAPDRG